MTIPDLFKQAVEHLQSLELPITEEEERIADELDADSPHPITIERISKLSEEIAESFKPGI